MSLFEAAKRGDVEGVRAHLGEAGSAKEGEDTALMQAASRGHLACVTLLLELEGGHQGCGGYTALMRAAVGNHPDCVDALLDREAGLRTCTGWTALICATNCKHSLVIPHLIPRECRLVTTDGWSALMVAAHKGYSDCARLLLDEAGLQTTSYLWGCPKGSTALMIAAIGNNLSVATLLKPYEQGLVDSDGHNALWHAKNKGHDNVAKLLADENPDAPRLLPGSESDVSLISAISNGKVELAMQKLNEAGRQDSDGATALMAAAEAGQLQLVNLLLEKEAGMVDEAGRTALMRAAARGHLDCIQVLLPYEGGRQSTKEWYDGIHASAKSTALMVAAGNGHASCVAVLLEREADARDEYGRTALIYAARGGHEDCVRALLRCAGIQDRGGVTALQLASMGGHVGIVRALASLEARLTDTGGRSALMCAAEKGHGKCAEVLVDHEASMQDIHGWTALMHAVAGERVECACLLLREAGAQSTELWDRYPVGTTATMIAVIKRSPEIVKLTSPREMGLMNSTGFTALMIALQGKDEVSAHLLLQEAAVRDKEGYTQLDIVESLCAGSPGDDPYSSLRECYRSMKEELKKVVDTFVPSRLARITRSYLVTTLEQLYRYGGLLIDLMVGDSRVSLSPLEEVIDILLSTVLGEEFYSLEELIKALDGLGYSLDDDPCVICLSHQADTLLLPCRHLGLCYLCLDSIKAKCPYCRADVTDSIVLDYPEFILERVPFASSS
ncbi:Ankyrin repeat protein 2 [Giardia muris]|uniref:Ankyrin repeat protein 2 n=1 Tax=Giardia muris TaxID=5742 RepID=A0A4Z1T0E6_GIAMU|nr:Ankyrin repeat protein 2 [Giardia muris]|eukprot:TNJ26387.1 Ankyrin repeat protein 2 [Giardia muris]